MILLKYIVKNDNIFFIIFKSHFLKTFLYLRISEAPCSILKFTLPRG